MVTEQQSKKLVGNSHRKTIVGSWLAIIIKMVDESMSTTVTKNNHKNSLQKLADDGQWNLAGKIHRTMVTKNDLPKLADNDHQTTFNKSMPTTVTEKW